MVDLVQASVPFRRALSGAAVAAAVLLGSPALAQKSLDPSMPLPPGVIREKGLEAAMARDGTQRQVLQIFKVGAPAEMVFTWYQKRLTPYEDAAQDTASLKPGESTPMTFHINWHAFVNECMEREGGAAASDTTAPCKRWRRGIDKQRALNNSRVALPGGKWVESFTITWFNREPSGQLVRRKIEARDAGLADNWQHDQLRTHIILERRVM